jgi:hypothetical protein
MGPLLQDAGLLVENSAQGIYLGLRRLLEDSILLAQLSAAAKHRGRTFSKTEAAARTEAYLLDALEEKRGKPWKFT